MDNPKPQFNATGVRAESKLNTPPGSRFKQFLSRLVILFEVPIRYLFGRDVFVSYSRQDGNYVTKLVTILKDKNRRTSFYFDQWAAPPGGELPASLKRHLRWSSILVLVGSQAAINSDSVKQEVSLFATRRRKVIPISVDNAFAQVDWNTEPWINIRGANREPESADAVASEKPSDTVISRIENSVTFTRQDQRQTRAVWGTITLVLALLAGGVVISRQIVKGAQTQAAERISAAAQREKVASDNARIAGQRQIDAEHARVDAENKKGIAEGLATKADQARVQAESLRDQAKEEQGLATQARERATAERLATTALADMTEHPQRSLLLSVEAVEVQKQARQKTSLIVEQALRQAISNAGGSPLRSEMKTEGSNLVDRGLSYSPDNRWLVLQQQTNPEGPILEGNEPTYHNVNKFQLWDLLGKTPSMVLTGEGIAKFSPDSQWLTASELWKLDGTTMKATKVPLKACDCETANVFFSADSRWLVYEPSNSPAVLYDLKDPGLKLRRVDPSAKPMAASFSEWAKRRSDKQATVSTGRWLSYWDPFKADLSVFDLLGNEPVVPEFIITELDYYQISEDGHWLITAQNEKPSLAWDLTHHGNDSPIKLEGWAIKIEENWTPPKFVFSSDGRWVASEVDGLHLWDLSDAPAKRTYFLRPGFGERESLRFSPDSRWLFAAQSAHTFSFDLTADPSVDRHILGSVDGWLTIEFSPIDAVTHQSRWIVAFNKYEEEAYAKDLKRKDFPESYKLRSPDGSMIFQGFTPDAHWLITSGSNVVRFWDLSEYNRGTWPNPTSPVALRGHEGKILNVVSSSDSRMLATLSDDGQPRLWNLLSIQPTAEPRSLDHFEGLNTTPALSNDHKWLLSSNDKTHSRLWNLTSPPGERQWQELPGISPSFAATFSDNSKWLVTTVETPGKQQGWLWYLRPDKAQKVLELSGEHVSPNFSSNGNYFVNSPYNALPQFWRLNANKPEASLIEVPLSQPGVRVRFSPDDEWLVTLTGLNNEQTVRMRRISEPVANEKVLSTHALATDGFVFSADSKWVMTVDNNGGQDEEAGVGLVQLWSLKSSLTTPFATFKDPGLTPKFSPDGKFFVAPLGIDKLRLFDLRPDSGPIDKELDGTEADFTADSKMLAIASKKGVVIWNLKPTSIKSIPLPPPPLDSGGLYSGSGFSSDGRWLIRSYNNRPVVWDLKNVKKKPQVFVTSDTESATARFSDDSKSLILLSSGTDPKLYDLTDRSPFKKFIELKGFSTASSFISKGRWLAVTDNNETALCDLSRRDWLPRCLTIGSGTLQFLSESSLIKKGDLLWDLDLDRLESLAVRTAGRELTKAEMSTVQLTNQQADKIATRKRTQAPK